MQPKSYFLEVDNNILLIKLKLLYFRHFYVIQSITVRSFFSCAQKLKQALLKTHGVALWGRYRKPAIASNKAITYLAKNIYVRLKVAVKKTKTLVENFLWIAWKRHYDQSKRYC